MSFQWSGLQSQCDHRESHILCAESLPNKEYFTQVLSHIHLNHIYRLIVWCIERKNWKRLSMQCNNAFLSLSVADCALSIMNQTHALHSHSLFNTKHSVINFIDRLINRLIFWTSIYAMDGTEWHRPTHDTQHSLWSLSISSQLFFVILFANISSNICIQSIQKIFD